MWPHASLAELRWVAHGISVAHVFGLGLIGHLRTGVLAGRLVLCACMSALADACNSGHALAAHSKYS
jgi:hypothetical protein